MALRLALTIDIVKRGFDNFQKAEGFLNKIAAGAKGAALGLSTLAGTEIIRFAEGSIRAFADFDSSIRRAAATITGGFAAFDQLEAKAKELGATTVFSAKQVAEGLIFLGQAGLDVGQAMAAIAPTINLAIVANSDLATAANIATNIMSGMGLEVTDLDRVMDVLTSTITGSNTDMLQLAEAMKTFAPIASQFGLSIEQAAAAIGTLATRGITASDAGTKLKIIFERVAKATDSMKNIFRDAGVNIEGVIAGEVDLITLLKQVEAGMKSGNITTEQFIQFFGRAQGAAFKLIESFDDTSTGLESLTDRLNSSQGATKQFVDQAIGPGAKALAEYKAAVESIQIELGQALIPIVIELVEVFKENQDAFFELIDLVRLAVPIVVTLVQAIARAREIFDKFIQQLEEKGIIDDMRETMEKLEKTIGANIDVVEILAQIFAGLAVGIGLLVVGIVALIKFGLWVNDILNRMGFLGEVIKVVFALAINPILGLVQAFKVLKIVWEALKPIGEKILEIITKITEAAKDAKEAVAASPVGKAVGFVGEGVKDLRGIGSFQRGGMFKVKAPTDIRVHPPEIVTVTNPNLAQTATLGGGQNVQMTNNIHIQRPGDLEAVMNQQRLAVRRMSRRR
jgi:TP901 family phage tail tape measure protein